MPLLLLLSCFADLLPPAMRKCTSTPQHQQQTQQQPQQRPQMPPRQQLLVVTAWRPWRLLR
jgi:hypothetical protein